MRLHNINIIEEANAFLATFIDQYNKRYGVEPTEPSDAHRPLDPKINLERVFARRATRKVQWKHYSSLLPSFF